jgi:hypothetical protein
MNIYDHWVFSLAGLYADSMNWRGEDGIQHFMLRFDFVGGKQSVELEEPEFNTIVPKLEIGTPVRIQGRILQNNGKPRLKISTTQIKGIDAGFKDLSVIEMRLGTAFRGVGEISERKSFVTKIGGSHYDVYVRAMGGLVLLHCSAERYSEIADKGCYIFDGRVGTDLVRNYESGKVSYSSQLVYQLDKVTLCDENGELVNKDVRRGGKDAA